jgi:hypothetical protein
MEPFEIVVTIINTLAVVAIPIVSVVVAHHLQNRAEKRKDKLNVFKTLMMSRTGWTVESVRALNIIDIVFADDENVRARWKEYYDKLCVEDPSDTELKKIKTAQEKLIEAMAVSLGYKDKVTWETIQNPYVPKGLIDAEQKQQEYQQGQLAMAKIAEQLAQNMPFAHNSTAPSTTEQRYPLTKMQIVDINMRYAMLLSIHKCTL